eukprot:TRINITY_DN8216_c0_g1_i8.p1 TRINITY_DN8216_c0_g1~~TRINITY_DN8216_c0_g1_i8.p1  ORF type:complete len:146 (-),score=18.07 TRINITY_DN8216_c0_g1_i8:65-502(-)
MFTDEDIIVAYSRKDALADGEQIQVNEFICQEAGLKHPVFFTKAVWNKYVKVPKGMEGMQNEEGRLWDILYMFAQRVKKGKESGEKFELTLEFQVSVCLPNVGDYERNEKRESENQRLITLKCEIGAFDYKDYTPVFTFSKPQEN